MGSEHQVGVVLKFGGQFGASSIHGSGKFGDEPRVVVEVWQAHNGRFRQPGVAHGGEAADGLETADGVENADGAETADGIENAAVSAAG